MCVCWCLYIRVLLVMLFSRSEFHPPVISISHDIFVVPTELRTKSDNPFSVCYAANTFLPCSWGFCTSYFGHLGVWLQILLQFCGLYYRKFSKTVTLGYNQICKVPQHVTQGGIINHYQNPPRTDLEASDQEGCLIFVVHYYFTGGLGQLTALNCRTDCCEGDLMLPYDNMY